MKTVVATLAALALASPVAAQAPPLSISATPAFGAAPLTVTLAVADAGTASYRWELGDGAAGEGAATSHVYARPGVYTAVVTATFADGTVATAATTVTAFRVSLAEPRPALTGMRVRLHGRIEPAIRGERVDLLRGDAVVASGRTGAGGRFVLTTRAREGAFRARIADGVSTPRMLRVVRTRLARGAHGRSVVALERRLLALRYALPRVDAVFGRDTYEAVLAFQKVHGLPWTGRVDARTWRRLLTAQPPRARYRGTHLEVSKGRQVLFAVRRGRVDAVVHVSTGATGNTPLGRWRIYRKVAGWDWILWYAMYFLRGFAVHGYPTVPAYPASHGCVRVPMWIAPRLFRTNRYGGRIYVYA